MKEFKIRKTKLIRYVQSNYNNIQNKFRHLKFMHRMTNRNLMLEDCTFLYPDYTGKKFWQTYIAPGLTKECNPVEGISHSTNAIYKSIRCNNNKRSHPPISAYKRGDIV